MEIIIRNDSDMSTIERAMMIAREGKVQSMARLREQVRRAGYVSTDADLSSPSVAIQLRRLLRAARTTP